MTKTPSALSWLDQADERYHSREETKKPGKSGERVLTSDERDALALASVTGQHAADWIRSLASRQHDEGSRQVLEQYAGAVEQILRYEIIPGGDGELVKELRYTLDAYVLLGSVQSGHRPKLTAAERVALLAIGFTALSSPRVVLNDLTDLVPLCQAIDQALAIGMADAAAAPKCRP
ncbi:hypothetical protein ACFU7Y_38970 [Kitasatospora sp. NPDC057542]|uniref:hypothetical protein n=1 Tax=Streptomycetaceae TaxID=2062 RepID=UPI001CC9E169|nr:hypothetical protein [Streptomyces sp. LS1784]